MNKRMIIALATLSLTPISGLLHADASFNDVENVIFGTPPAPQSDIEKQEQSVYKQNLLPQYLVTTRNFFKAGINMLAVDSVRTIAETADYYPRIEKLVHSNGICFTGNWAITENTAYTGYFKQGAQGLFIGRASTALSETKRGQPRAFGFAGKIFPTLNPSLETKTANFFLVDVLAGVQRDHYLDVKMTNRPETGFRWSIIGLAITAANAFARADINPGFRPLYPISELGLAPGEIAKTPQYMLLKGSAQTLRNNEIDFRDELNIEKNNAGQLMFDIMVSDTTSDKNSTAWQKIGQITLNQSKVSYGCDRELHFHHPKIK